MRTVTREKFHQLLANAIAMQLAAMAVALKEEEKPMYLTEDETSTVQRNRIQARAQTEIEMRANGLFDWADRTRDNTDTLIRGGEIRRRRGGPRDDE
jgi:hypothetical protein